MPDMSITEASDIMHYLCLDYSAVLEIVALVRLCVLHHPLNEVLEFVLHLTIVHNKRAGNAKPQLWQHPKNYVCRGMLSAYF
jgi:hypothetical protein